MNRLRATLATVMLIYFVAVVTQQPPAYAQEQSRFTDLERRTTVIEAERFGERLARVEATVEMNNKLVVAVFLAVVLMLLERVSTTIRKRTPEQEK